MGENITAAAPAHVTVEQTKKKYKIQYLIGWALVFIGPLFVIALGMALISLGFRLDPELMARLTVGAPAVGIAWLIVTRCRVWWHHG